MPRWWPFSRERVRVDLDPSQIVAVQFLFRYKAAPEDKIYDQVAATTYLDHTTFLVSLGDLVNKGILEPHAQEDPTQTWFVLTKLGKRLRGKIPPDSRSAVAIYV
ncbi:MAG TPA: hypothetical protein VFY90_01905 [Tepidiformaceae bacterium]|nr:hypothetical protein [Tepidiformaceae bacterium]